MPRQAVSPPLPHPRPMDPKIWRACAGASVQIPTLHSRVYYFPQGHFDQASSVPRHLSKLLRSKSFILCRITSVQFLADPLTDEVFAKLVLVPVSDYFAAPSSVPPTAASDDDVVSFAKILTPSDANNGGGFSVPRFCADSIFPPLNFQDDPPVQNLSVTDVHGVAWEFRHIYRGTPRRHLLTTGWSKFVNNKKLVAGDSVVFMKNSRGGLFVGVRRATRFTSGKGGGNVGSNWSLQIGGMENRVEEEEKEEEEENLSEVFSRDGKGKLSTKKVAEAAELAALNMAFEVVYYPKAGWSEFVVNEEAVNEAMSVAWGPGMRVKMAMETDDSSRMTWFQGTVSCVSVNENGQWRYSPWRMLQITWDEPEVLQNSKWVSPWQVELVSTTPALHSAFPSAKRFRSSQGSEVFTDGEGDPFSMTRFTNSAMSPLNQTLLSYGTFPAGMQGARHDLFSAPSFSNFPSDASRLCMGNSLGNNMVPRLTTLPTELNVGSPQSDNLSPNSNSSLHSCATELVGNHNCNSTKPGNRSFPSDTSRLCMGNSLGNNTVPKLTLSTELNVGCFQSDDLSPNSNSSLHSCATELVGNHNYNSTKPKSVSIHLFGNLIQINSVECDLHGTGLTGVDSRKGCNETEGISNPLDDSLACSKLPDRLDDQCQSASKVGTWYFSK
ncbi:auxin response factor 17-like [Abrus precatorius]|uniref:Auxin response factor n=1 Tax=Abrus precatorius TaxID=3816 RepID=A0A8B8K606_ABRPR|nr:auxin response factor 17-like [Abrus precatorius]